MVAATPDVLATASPIRDYGPVSREQFDREVRPAGQPAIFRKLALEWPAVQAARESDERLLSYLTTFPVARPVGAIVGEPDIDGRFFYKPGLTELNFQRVRSEFGPVLARLMKDRAEQHPYAMAVQSEPLRELLPGFAEQNRIDLVSDEVGPRAWIGNRIRVATHYDLQENIGVVVAGRRRFLLFPADQMPNMYIGPIELTPAGTPVSLVDPLAPDLAQFPRFAEALRHAQVATLEPGDAIYIPFHWWHAVDSLSPFNLFVNYWWNAALPGLGSGYDALLHAVYAIRNLPPDQRAAWRVTFDHYIFRTETDAAEHLPLDVRGPLGEPTPTLIARLRSALKQIIQNG